MRRVVMFVGPTRPETREAAEPPTSTEPLSAVRDPAPERPLDVGSAAPEQLHEPGIVDAVAREG